MPGNPPSLTPRDVASAVHTIVADVLFVPEDEVRAEKSLVRDLGAESIDFLDLLFRLEDTLEKKITIARFDQWMRSRAAGGRKDDVTVAIFIEFALEEAEAKAQRQDSA